jgi:hypothetical protein
LLRSGLRLLDVLVDTTNGGSSGGTSGRVALWSTSSAATNLALGGDDLVEGLVELSRHGEWK